MSSRTGADLLHEGNRVAGTDTDHEDWFGGLRWPPASLHPRPLKKSFYVDLRQRLSNSKMQSPQLIPAGRGLAVDLEAGRTITIRLLEGPQIVNLWAFNTRDTDERLWAQDGCLIEGLYLTRYSRLWGEMALFRPLLTVLEDSVSPVRGRGRPPVPHHFVFGGGGTPEIWRRGGGAASVSTTWEQFVDLAKPYGIPPHRITDNVCLFQKTAVESETQRFVILPSDALTGDRVTLYAEIDVTVLLVLSPYVDGSRTPRQIGDLRPRAVETVVSEVLETPLGWPYPGMPYPDMSLYLNESGTREQTPGRTLLKAQP